MTSPTDPGPAAALDVPAAPESGRRFDVHAWERPRRVSITEGKQTVSGHALAERSGSSGKEILVCLDGKHLTWVPAQRVSPLPDAPGDEGPSSGASV